MAKTQVVRMTPEAVRVADHLVDALAGDDSVLALVAGVGPLNRSQVVILACQLLTLIAQGLAKSDEPDPRLVTNVVPNHVLVLADRWYARTRQYDTEASRVRWAHALAEIRQIAKDALRGEADEGGAA